MNISIKKYSGIYILKATQQLNASLADAWDYFATPANLQSITPENIGFEITSGNDGDMYPGKLITYQISIFPLIKNKWVTEITHIAHQKYFIDEQRKGPYAMWHHEHHFEENAKGVLMTDLVSYKLPIGFAGRMVAGRLVAKKLHDIFSFRYKTLQQYFG
jgi:ligand-binding SRPBCC domain-containing protein